MRSAPIGSGSPPPVEDPARHRRLRRAAMAAVILLAFCLSLSPIATTDFFWHLKTGEWILQEGRIPRTDPFSYRSGGQPWVDLHWGFQAWVAAVHSVSGIDGLNLWRALVVSATAFLLLAGFAWRPDSLAALAAVLLVVVAAHERFLLRPEVVSFLLLAAVLAALERGAGSGRRGLVLVAALMLLWVNLHSLFIVGLAVLGLALAGGLLDRTRSRFDVLPVPGGGGGARPDLLWGAWALGLGTLAALVNPYGYRSFTLPLLQLQERIAPGTLYARTIAEFQRPVDPTVGTLAIGAGWTLWIAAASLVWFGYRRLPARHLLYFLAFSWLAWRARRNLPVFAIGAAPGIILALRDLGGRGLGRAVRRGVRGWGPAVLAATGLLLAASVCTGRFYLWERMERSFGSGVRAGVAPAGAVDFILENPLPGRLFHDLDSAGYLLWRAYPEKKVFLDGRLEVHSEETFRTYLQVQADPERFEEVAAREGIDRVLWAHSQAGNARHLLGHLQGSPDWRLVRLDATASVFQRADVEDRPAIDPETLVPTEVLDTGLPPSTPLGRIVDRLVPFRVQPPVTAVETGLALSYLGAPRSGERFLLRAVEDPGSTPEVEFNLGLLYEKMGLNEKAILRYEQVRTADRFLADPLGWLVRRDFRRQVLMRLGEGYYRIDLPDRGRQFLERAGKRGEARLLAMEGFRRHQEGDLTGAVDLYRQSLRRDPGRPEVLHNLGLALLEADRIPEAESVLEETLQANPRDAEAHYNLGNIRYARGEFPEAARAYESSVRLRPDFSEAHFNLGMTRLRSGDLPGAVHALEEAVRLAPERPEFLYQLGLARARRGDLDGAAAAYSEAVGFREDFVEARFNLGGILMRGGRHREALEQYRKCLDLGMDHPQLFLQLARVHALLGESRPALEWLRRVPLPRAADRRNLARQMPELAPILELLTSGN